MSIDDAAVFLGLKKPTIYQFVSKATIPHFKKSKRLYFSKSDLRKWLQDSRRYTIKEIEDSI